MTANIENIIIKYLTNAANADELDTLAEWLAIDNNKIAFKELIKDHYTINYALNNPDSDLLIEMLLERIREDKNRVIKLRRNVILKYAAIFIGFISIAYLGTIIYNNQHKDSIIISDTDIVLKLDNGNVKIISSEGKEKIVNEDGVVVGEQKGNELNYATNSSRDNLLKYNELLVPYGRTFDIILSDGTKVKLNAGSSIKYPVKFVAVGNREVFLKGEAYFQVTKDAQHPFIVNANDINIRVLGTEFNVSAYTDDNLINTVLVEGSVGIYEENESFNPATSILLKPGFKAEIQKNNGNVVVNKVDTAIYTSWVSGKLIIKNNSFAEIRKKLERKYNVSIINNNKLLEKNTFSAVFDIESIEEVMEVLRRSYGIQYEIKDNQIIIN